MIRHLKTGLAAGQQAADDAAVRETVSAILRDVEQGGMDAVRRYSQELDNWSPPSFRLSAEEIQPNIGALPPQTVAGIRIRRYAGRDDIRGLDKLP